ncbi:hypothetical protein ES703_07084 [subsurface metagenome]
MKIKTLWLGLLLASQLLATWPATITTTAGKDFFPQIVSDGSGGAIISWLHKNSYDCYEVYGARVESDGDVAWRRENISHMNLAGTNVGHRLNHHVIPSTSNSAIYFWANHFQLDNYARGYYLQKTNGSGVPQWPEEPPDDDPVQVLPTWPVPAPNDGEPISICPDGEGGCVVAMKAATTSGGSPHWKSWKIWVTRYDASGISQWPEQGGKGIVIDEPQVNYYYQDDDTILVCEYLGCPKVVRWGEDEFMVLWTSVTEASATDTCAGTFRINSKTTLHIYRIDEDGVEQAHDESVNFEADEVEQVYGSPDPYGYCRWYWWIPDFQITTNSSRDKLFVAFLKRFKHRRATSDSRSWSFREDYLYVLEYSSPSSWDTTRVEGFSWIGEAAHNFNGDWCPLRSPSIICVNDAAVVCVPRSTDNPPYLTNNEWVKNYPLYRTFHLKVWKVLDGTPTHLWDKTGYSFHTPQLIGDPSGGLLLAYSRHTFQDYNSNSSYLSHVIIERHNPITQTSPNSGWPQTPGNQGTNTSPRIILSDANHVIVTWAASDDGKDSWRIMAQRYDMSGNP